MRPTLLRVAIVALPFLAGFVPRSFAQEIAPTGEYKDGMAVGGWTLYPKIYLGATYDDNTHQTAKESPHSSNIGARFVPNLVATLDNGIHKTTIYGVVDAHFHDTNTLAATAGFSHVYEMMRDLVWNFQGNYTRQTDVFNSALNFNNGAIGPTTSSNIPIVINPFGTTPGINPIPYNQFTAGASVTKSIDKAFISLSAVGYYIAFDRPDSAPNPFHTSHDATSLWSAVRVGYDVTPAMYVFAEGNGIFQRFNNSLFNTNGYRVIGGVGSNEASGLFKGEVYGGYQVQNQEHQVFLGTGIPGDVSSGVYGGRLSYYPTRYWTVIASVDQSLGLSSILTPNVPEGMPTRVTTAMLQTNYGLAREWSLGARFGYTRGEFIGISRVDNGWLAGASFNYEVWRNLLLTLDYQYTTVHSDAAFSDFTRNIYTAGLTYRY